MWGYPYFILGFVVGVRCNLQVSDMLDRLYEEFDNLADLHGVYKVPQTIQQRSEPPSCH